MGPWVQEALGMSGGLETRYFAELLVPLKVGISLSFTDEEICFEHVSN